MQRLFKRHGRLKAVAAVLALIAVFGVFMAMRSSSDVDKSLSLMDVVVMAREGKVAEIVVRDGTLRTTGIDGDEGKARVDVGDTTQTDLLTFLEEHGVDVGPAGTTVLYKPPERTDRLKDAAIGVAPLLVFAGIGLFVFLRIRGFGSRAAVTDAKRSTTTFADVAGNVELVGELTEIVDCLANARRFRDMGAKIPTGILLSGPPGTGKTLMAKAVAGEAKAKFYMVNGSQFTEMFAGLGAMRIRSLFKAARSNAPSVIFIDELDTIGTHRTTQGGSMSNEYRQQLTQLLAEMDGFDKADPDDPAVVVIGATNTLQDLDKALIRPGRFDRHLSVSLPDIQEREAILSIHANTRRIDPAVDLSSIAKRTMGLSGADLANIVNEASILAVRRAGSMVDNGDLSEAVLKVSLGPARRSLHLSAESRRRAAFHEAGHAILAWANPSAPDVSTLSIVPRGGSAGHTSFSSDLPTLPTKAIMEAYLGVFLGGWAAESTVFDGDISAGSTSDITRAGKLVEQMVDSGMDGRFPIGPKARRAACDRLMNAAVERTKATIALYGNSLHTLATHLLDEEVMDAGRVFELMGSKPPVPGAQVPQLNGRHN